MTTLGSPAPPKLSRKEREHQFRVDIVLDAAEEVFGDRSFAKASVEDIAEGAEISVGTLYNLFRSKEDIYRAVVSRAQNGFFDALDVELDAARGPREQVQAVVTHYFNHFSRYSRQMRLYTSAANGFQWDLKSKLTEEAHLRETEFRHRFTDICQAGIDSGMFKQGVPAPFLALNLIGVPHSFLMAWISEEDGELMDMLPHALAIVDRLLGTDG